MDEFQPTAPEPFYTLKDAAKRLNIKYHALLRAANRGDIPTYAQFNSRRLVRLSDIVAAMRDGGRLA